MVLATWQAIERRAFHAHTQVPLMKLLEQVWINLEQIQGRRIRHARRFHEAQEQEEIAQLGGLLTQIALVARERGALENLREVGAQLR
jgi:hypothetical protein